MIPTIAILLIVAGAIAAFGMASWRGSEESYERWRSRRGEDEPRERFDDRGRCGAG